MTDVLQDTRDFYYSAVDVCEADWSRTLRLVQPPLVPSTRAGSLM